MPGPQKNHPPSMPSALSPVSIAEHEALKQELCLLKQQMLELEQQAASSAQALQIQSEQVAKAVERERAVAAVIDKIRRSLDLSTIFQTTTQEVRRLLNADRVGIYRFADDWSGEFVVESVGEGWQSLLLEQQQNLALKENISACSAKLLADFPALDSANALPDTYLRDSAGGSFATGEIFRVCSDIYGSGFSNCYVRALERYQARAYVVVAIYQGARLWGLLAAYQNDGPRQWEGREVNFMAQIGAQLGVALQQAELLGQAEYRSTLLQNRLEAQLRQRAAELSAEAQRERAIGEVVEKIRQTLDIATIFQTTATEVQMLLNADRVAMFKFDGE